MTMTMTMPGKFVFAAASLFLLLGAGACQKRTVPEDIVDKSLARELVNAPRTATSLCGVFVQGFSSVKSTIKTRGENNTGVAHVVGTPWPTRGKPAPAKCEGDVEYAFSYTSKTTRLGRRRQTNVTWSLTSFKLVAVTTPGVTPGMADKALKDVDPEEVITDPPSAAR